MLIFYLAVNLNEFLFFRNLKLSIVHTGSSAEIEEMEQTEQRFGQ